MFVSAASLGIKPDELLDMELWMFLAYQKGQQEVLKQQTTLAIQTGYYAGYYSGFTKGKKKSPDEIIRAMFKKTSNSEPKPLDKNAIERLKAFEEYRNKLRSQQYE